MLHKGDYADQDADIGGQVLATGALALPVQTVE